jgi:hypothetical protein
MLNFSNLMYYNEQEDDEIKEFAVKLDREHY